MNVRPSVWPVWVWLIVGAACGLGLSLVYGEPGPGAGDQRVGFGTFVAAVSMSSARQPLISNIIVYPPRDGIYLITFSRRDPTGHERASYAYGKDSPAGTQRDWRTPTEFLDRLKQTREGFSYRFAWWTSDEWRERIGAGAGLILIGGVASLLFISARRKARAARKSAYVFPESSPAQATVPPPPKPAIDEALGEYLEAATRGATIDSAGETTAQPATKAESAPVALRGETLQALPEREKEAKDYRGEFYPTQRGKSVGGKSPGGNSPAHNSSHDSHAGFSLIELLVVIGIIGILLAILLPTLAAARRAGYTISCAANLRTIGQAMQIYLNENRNTFPASYLYIGHKIENDVQTPDDPSVGYIHWSSYLFGSGKVPAAAFTCPEMNRGGLPPTDPAPDNLNPGQVSASVSVVDQQVPRLAYTMNEVLCPRNKFVEGFQGAQRIYRFVKASEVADSSGTILGTEWVDNGTLISRGESTGWVMSHRPVHGFIGLGGSLDIFGTAPGTGFRRATVNDLDPDPMTETSTGSRLDWVGRNHGLKRAYPDRRLSNFLYVDGHVVTKSVYDTISPWQWGAKFYSLVPSDDLQQ